MAVGVRVLGAIDVGVLEVGVAVGILVGTPVGILVVGDLVTTNAQHRHQRSIEDAIDSCSSDSCSSTQARERKRERKRERRVLCVVA